MDTGEIGMSKLDIHIHHRLTIEEASRRIRELLGQMKREFGDHITDLNENWNADSCQFSFTVMGSAINGTLDILSDEVQIKSDLPFAASLFKGRIEESIREKAAELLS